MAAVHPAFAKVDATDALGFSVGFDYTSDYLWRGMYVYNHDAAFFPFVNLKLGDFTLGYIGEYSEDYVTMKDNGDQTRLSDKKHTADLGVDFAHTFKRALTLGVSAWYYRFINDSTKDFGSGTAFLAFDGIPFKPMIRYTHDYYVETKKKMNFYVQFGLSRDIEIRDAGFRISAVAGYYNADTMDKRGISDITGSLGLFTIVSNVTLNGAFNYVYVPSHAFYRIRQSSGVVIVDKQRTYATFGASLSI